MIVHIDHLAFTTTDLMQDIKNLQTNGYSLRFCECAVKNIDIKKDLMRNFTQTHDLALLDHKENISIELIKYPQIYLPKINEVQKNYDFKKIIINAYNFSESIKFWKCLGFKECSQDTVKACLSFRSLLKNCEYFISLQKKTDFNKKIYLDDLGFSSIALISTSINNDRNLFKKQNFDVTPIEALELNGKKLNIFFAVGPSYELVEIIEINR